MAQVEIVSERTPVCRVYCEPDSLCLRAEGTITAIARHSRQLNWPRIRLLWIAQRSKADAPDTGFGADVLSLIMQFLVITEAQLRKEAAMWWASTDWNGLPAPAARERRYR